MARARKPTWLIIGVLSLSGILSALQQTMIIAQLPVVPELYDVSPDDASWMITATLLTGAIGTPILSRLADMFGKKRMIVLSMLLLVAGSIIAVLPLGFVALIVGRGLQGVSAALVPIAMSIMRDELPRERLGFGLALMGGTIGIGGALGMSISGVLYESFGFDSIFWLSAIVGSLTLVAVMVTVSESSARVRGRFDLIGALMLAAALVGLLLGISKGGSWGWTSTETIVSFASSLVLFAVWFPVQLRTRVPMVDLRLAARRPVLLTNIAAVASTIAMFTNLLITAQQLQQPAPAGGFGLDPMTAGLWMLPPALTWFFLSPISGVLLARIGARNTIVVGCTALVGAYIYKLLMDSSAIEVVIASCLVHVGSTLTFAAIPAMIMSSVPVTETASANGVNSLVRSIGSATASAVVGGLLATIALPIGGVMHPKPEAFTIVVFVALGAAVVSMVVSLFIPRRNREPVVEPSVDQAPPVRAEIELDEMEVDEIEIVDVELEDEAGASVRSQG